MFTRTQLILGVAIVLVWSTSTRAAATFVANFEDPLESTDGRTASVNIQSTFPNGSPAGITLGKAEDYFHFVDLSSFPGTSSFGQRSLQAAHQPEDQGPGNNPFDIAVYGKANHVSIDFGDFGGDSDPLFLRALDDGFNVIASVTDVLPGGGSEFRSKTLELDHPGIKFVQFFGGPVGNNDMLFDNFTYTLDESTPPSAIPLPPAAYAAIATCALALLVQRRMRRSKFA